MSKSLSISKVLFLCTGNYYRSRFAELLFNSRTRDALLSWQAYSRGLALERGSKNVGPISVLAVKGLETRGIHVPPGVRLPLQVCEQDLHAADLVIALKEAEHRPLLAQRFPAWPDRVEYWHIDDLDVATSETALTAIDQEVTGLLARLSRANASVAAGPLGTR
jgi:protein-tyrosine phosphatase